MELRQLKYFVTVIETGSFHAAAEALNLTPQAISRSIQRLEEAYSTRLLNRSKGSHQWISPTVYGKILLPRARQIIAQAQLFNEEMDNYLGMGNDLIRLGVSPNVSRCLLPGLINRFREAQPNVRLQIMESSLDSLYKSLSDRTFDLAICDEPEEVILGEEFETEKLFTDHCAFVVRAQHPLVHSTSLEIQDLTAFNWMMLGPYRRSGFELTRICKDAGIGYQPRHLDTSSVHLSIECLLNSDYITYIPVRLVAPELRDGRLVTLPVNGASLASWSVLLVIRQDAAWPNGIGQFLNILKQEVAAQPVIPNQSSRLQ